MLSARFWVPHPSTALGQALRRSTYFRSLPTLPASRALAFSVG